MLQNVLFNSIEVSFLVYRLGRILQKSKKHFQTTLRSLMKGGVEQAVGGWAWLFLQKLISRDWNKRWKVQELKEYRFYTLEKIVSRRL